MVSIFLFLVISQFSEFPIYLNLIQYHPLVGTDGEEAHWRIFNTTRED